MSAGKADLLTNAAASLSPDARLWWMAEFALAGDRASLAATRLAWLMLQSMLRPERPCRPMPGDPQPHFWPSHATKPVHRAPRPMIGETMIERLKRTYRVEDIASRLTQLYGAGDLLTGRCPLHAERKGRAFAVWVSEQRWRCFGRCATGGDVIDLVRECKARGLAWR